MKKKPTGPMTAEELVTRLSADADYVAKRVADERSFEQARQELRCAEEPLVTALREAGYLVESVWDLVNTATEYPNAIELLFEHLLRREYPATVREGIARALAVPAARAKWDLLIGTYRVEDDRRVKDGLAAALAAASDASVIDEVIELACDATHGPSRLLLLDALKRSDVPRARDALKQLATDPELSKEVRLILRRVKGRIDPEAGRRS